MKTPSTAAAAHPKSSNAPGTALVLAGCQRWPDLPSRTLARKLVAAHPTVWSGIETCRKAVLTRRGRMKVRGRPGVAFTIPSKCPAVPWNPSKYLPKSFESDFKPFVISTDRDLRGLILGDIHIPYHNIKAVTATLERGRQQDCRLVILNGDTLDFHRLSRFNKDPKSRSTKDEIAAANQLLDAIDDLFPNAIKIWRDGNHEDRYGHYVVAFAPELFDLVAEKCSLPQLLDLPGRGWQYVSEKRPIYLGGLTLIHGHEYPTPVLGPVNAARGLFLRTKASAMVSHHHQSSEHTETTIRDKMITTWSLGCLCDLHPQYARFNKWNHGAATVELAKSGAFQVDNFRILNGEIL